jgi:hypothetical protein
MNDDLKELLLSELESVANFLRGMSLDPALPKHTKEALQFRISKIDKLTEQHTE